MSLPRYQSLEQFASSAFDRWTTRTCDLFKDRNGLVSKRKVMR